MEDGMVDGVGVWLVMLQGMVTVSVSRSPTWIEPNDGDASHLSLEQPTDSRFNLSSVPFLLYLRYFISSREFLSV